MKTADDEYSPEETERRARDAVRRSFQTPYKPQKEFIGKTKRAGKGKPARSKTPPKSP
jgi:hypothetical protein